MSVASRVGQRLSSIFRNRRVRVVIFLVGGYKLYTAGTTYNTLYKTFSAHRHRPGQTILDLDLDSVQLVADDIPSPFTSAEEVRLEQLIATLEAAKADPRVTGLIVRGLGGLRGVGLAEITELRNVIKDFSGGWGGKQTMLHVPEGLGGAGNGTIPLYFAAAFDSVHVQPTSGILIPGLSAATLFFKKLLENVGIKAKKVARKEFKTAVNSFTEEKYTDPHRESTAALLTATMNHLVKDVAEGRGVTQDDVRNAFDVGIMSSEEAIEFGIIDECLYRDELPDAMRERLYAAAEKRAEARQVAAVEWREAMAELRKIWSVEGGAGDVWADGDILQHVGNVQEAIPIALSFADLRHDLMQKTVNAEIRALKAHLQWLDTWPWEAGESKGEKKDIVFRAIPHISSVLEMERLLCQNSLEALQRCPQILKSIRELSENNEVLKVEQENALSLIRWCRSMWTAKCLAARMVGTMENMEDEVGPLLKADPSHTVRKAVEEWASRPRIFLAGFPDDLQNIVSSALEPPLPVGVEVISADAEKVEIDQKKARNLRYVKLSDYADTLNTEMRAVLDRSSSPIQLVNSNPLLKYPGMVDNQERNALLRLQLPGYQISPWRFKIPKGDVIAIINVKGAISDDRADVTRAAIRRADKDPNVKGIVLRIDSPGGSATASDLISRAVEVAKKPVVASMGSVCASGGYFISALCDKVYASSMTITGSIGVILSAANTAGLYEKLGITTDSVESARFSKHYGVEGSVTEWSEEYATRIDQMIDKFYVDFVKIVARGRGMEFEQAEKIARGRVWAGSDAHSIGLVDEIGGLREAVKAAAELAHLAPDAKVRAIGYPTVGMLLQDAARKRGLIPSNLDEEGDEAVTKKRRRSMLRFQSEDPESDHADAPAPATASALAEISSEVADTYHNVLGIVLSRLDRYLLSAPAPSRSAAFVEFVFGKVMLALGENASAKLLADEMEVVRATAGRPSAIAPSVHIE